MVVDFKRNPKTLGMSYKSTADGREFDFIGEPNVDTQEQVTQAVKSILQTQKDEMIFHPGEGFDSGAITRTRSYSDGTKITPADLTKVEVLRALEKEDRIDPPLQTLEVIFDEVTRAVLCKFTARLINGQKLEAEERLGVFFDGY
jgi:hypothetical protein